jgi:hypothetical protein
MSSRRPKFTQSDARRLFQAAATAGVNLRVEFRPDGTIIASTGNGGALPVIDSLNVDLDEWMKKHHASSA